MSLLSFRRKSSDVPTATTLGARDGVDDPKGSLGLNLLHCPSEPLVEFIFVHGLGGGSRKTWSKSSSASHYWPQEWLPKDPAFAHVRVHSFGYDSDWAKGKDNCLNIHHFGKSLLGEMSTSPHLADANTSIVLIGHSMGGLVIKKAHILARQSAIHATLSERFHTILFLATPHRGSDPAKLLNNILHITSSSRAYVAELERGSGAIQTINDEFRHYSNDVVLWSFYETQMLRMGVLSSMIVDPDSATLGYREEKQMPMNADHRSICKFEAPTDPNYVTLRNSLASTVGDISKLAMKTKQKLRQMQLKSLRNYLKAPENPEEDLISVEEARLHGTCEWFRTKESYQKWRGSRVGTPNILWVNGKPAAGKSVLAGYIVDQLQSNEAGCSYFFFRHGDRSKSRLAACLRSLALQMASTNLQIREILMGMLDEGVNIDLDNERNVWQNMFLNGIFRTPFSSHHWVIDALDECDNFASFLVPMLAKMDESVHLRILITSQGTSELQKLFTTLGKHKVLSETIASTDTLADIEILVKAKIGDVLVKDEKERTRLMEKVLTKSEASFLWTALILNQLSTSYGEKEINLALEDMPPEMEPLYQRTLDLMSRASSGKKLTKAILAWTTCSMKPLTIKQLEEALSLDLQDRFPRLEECILALCGHLIIIDQFDRVQLLHETARAFLLNNSLISEFAIKKKDAHTRIARVCLVYLTGNEMRPPRTGKRSDISAPFKKSIFSTYACSAFSYHLARADPLSHEVWVLINKFLESNVLSWIEAVAETQDLVLLVRTAKNLRTYIHACTAERSPLDQSMQIIRSWSTDLVRLVAKFGDALTTSPSAIHFLILPFCPAESSIHRITKSGRKLAVVGRSNLQWDDRVSCFDFREGQTSAIRYGDDVLAVGLTTGAVLLYHSSSDQVRKSLNHGEAVRILQFKDNSGLMASCGLKAIRIWDTHSGHLLYHFQSPSRYMCIAFDESLLIAASVKNHLSIWDLDDKGSQQSNRPWTDFGEPTDRPFHRVPCAISIAVAHRMLAVAYIGRPIMLWDLEEDQYYGSCGKKLDNGETSTHLVTALVLNPSPDIDLLAVSYLDGELALLDPFDDRELESFRANCHTLTASNDGRLLAGGAAAGTIHIYEFDSLKLLYRVKCSDLYIKQLDFSKDGYRLADIRGSHCNVWEPAILLSDASGDDSGQGTSSSFVDVVASENGVKITALIVHPREAIVFCGMNDGSIALYDTRTGVEMQSLHCHKTLVRSLTWSGDNNSILSVDASNGICSWPLKKSHKEGWVIDTPVFRSRLDRGESIIQVLVGEATGKFVLSTRKSDHLWSTAGQEEQARDYQHTPEIRKWMQHPQSPLHMICFKGALARIYAWEDWSVVKSVSINTNSIGLQLKSIFSIQQTASQPSQILLELSELDGPPDTRALCLLDGASFTLAKLNIQDENCEVRLLEKGKDEVYASSKPEAALISIPVLSLELSALAARVTHVIGLGSSNEIIFLDIKSWVCSARLDDLCGNTVFYSRHFFVPHEWFAGARDLISAVARRDIAFAASYGLAIVKGGLDFEDKTTINVKNANKPPKATE